MPENTTGAEAQAPAAPPLPDFFIGKSLMNQRIQRYRDGKYELLCDDMEERGFHQGETVSVWYERAYIKTLLDEIDRIGGDGLRIYFGEYEAEPDKPQGQLCLLMVPTRTKGDGVTHADVLLEEETDFMARYNAREALGQAGRGFNIAAPNPPVHVGMEFRFPIIE
jgi:hypothetical protein